MWAFIKNTLSTVVGTIIALLLLTLITFLIITSLTTEDAIDIDPKSVLHIKLNKKINEKGNDNPLKELDLPLRSFRDDIGLVELRKVLKKAAKDKNIDAVFLELSMLQAGYAKTEELRQALENFKNSDKKVFVYSETLSEKAYYLASVADQIYLTPEGLVEFRGLKSETMYIKGTLEKLNIEPKIFKVGQYKSAVEIFTKKEMSEPNRLQVESFLNDIYSHNIKQIAVSRQYSSDSLRKISDSLLVRNSNDAVKHRLIDHNGYYDEFLEEIKSQLELEEKPELVSFKSYLRRMQLLDKVPNKDKNVAVMIADGEIAPGKSSDGIIGAESFCSTLREIREDDKIKAVVLRINSPGGSALASDIMWREVKLLAEKKPVITSMSDVAASGGYYIAMASDTIVAQPNTITGSIGVFGVLFNATDFFEDKLGITFDRVKTGPYADLGSGTRPMTKKDSMIIQHEVNRIYDVFTQKAADDRNMPVGQLHEIAEGRVWTGAQAQENGLVDVLGGLDKAINIAAKKAELDSNAYNITYYPKEKGLLSGLSNSEAAALKEELTKEELGEYYYYLRKLKRIQNWQGVQARMPYDIEIQ